MRSWNPSRLIFLKTSEDRQGSAKKRKKSILEETTRRARTATTNVFKTSDVSCAREHACA